MNRQHREKAARILAEPRTKKQRKAGKAKQRELPNLDCTRLSADRKPDMRNEVKSHWQSISNAAPIGEFVEDAKISSRL